MSITRPVRGSGPAGGRGRWLLASFVVPPIDGRPADAPTPERSRRGAHPLARLLVFLGVAGALGAAGAGASLLVDPTGPADGVGMHVTAVALIVAAVAGYLVVTVRLEGRRPPVELSPRRAGGLLAGATLGTALVLVSAALAWALGGLTVEGTRPAGELAWASDLLMTGLFAAVVEEVLFRGMVFRLLEQTLGSWAGVGISAVVFGSVHAFAAEATVVSTLNTVVEAGLLLAVVYLITRSLWVVIGLHAAWNVVLSNVLGIPVSGNTNEGLVITHPSGSEVISGGAYGLEASLVTLVVLTAVAVTGLVFAQRRGLMVARPGRGGRHSILVTSQPAR